MFVMNLNTFVQVLFENGPCGQFFILFLCMGRNLNFIFLIYSF